MAEYFQKFHTPNCRFPVKFISCFNTQHRGSFTCSYIAYLHMRHFRGFILNNLVLPFLINELLFRLSLDFILFIIGINATNTHYILVFKNGPFLQLSKF